jgi:hypothetical protein
MYQIIRTSGDYARKVCRKNVECCAQVSCLPRYWTRNVRPDDLRRPDLVEVAAAAVMTINPQCHMFYLDSDP